MALGNKSGDQVGSIHEKNQRSKISWNYPFKTCGDHLGIAQQVIETFEAML